MSGRNMLGAYAIAYGSPDVLEVRELPIPSPSGKEVLIKVNAAAVTRAGCMMRTGRPLFGRLMLGLFRPKHPVPGSTFAGEIVAVGSQVSEFKVGERVAGNAAEKGGSHAQYLVTPADGVIVPLPDHISDPVGAVICDGGITGLNFMKVVSGVEFGHRVLINGASGSVGSSALQVAKSLGAHVTAVCGSNNIEYVKNLGADEVIDYRTQNVMKHGKKFDVFFDTVANYSLKKVRSILTESGIYVSPVISWPLLGSVLFSGVAGKQKAKFAATGLAESTIQRKWMKDVISLIDSKKIQFEVNHVYSLSQIREANQFIDSGHKRGNAIIDMTLPISH
ncbi:MAG: NAD(P)-dependent alcohol dehydrogenase [Fimbriimonadaceae bacterium]|nr:MAG: NAD(P)-dependent alcohol dehydrogenase [Fimbriimonadaceae bacterium]